MSIERQNARNSGRFETRSLLLRSPIANLHTSSSRRRLELPEQRVSGPPVAIQDEGGRARAPQQRTSSFFVSACRYANSGFVGGGRAALHVIDEGSELRHD